ncbi:MAG: glycosyltransferase family 2 protein [Pseudomonadales bacterium]|nr:glycosyltransferase family 2 protein [Pseudomonadales bacterium]
MYYDHHVTCVIPALDEAKSIGKVVTDFSGLTNADGSMVIDTIIVCDNGSQDGTPCIAKKAGAQVVFEPIPGYGQACMTGMAAIKQTDIVLFVDGDGSFIADQAMPLLNGIITGADLVIGSRTLGNVAAGAMSQQQLWGNKLSTLLIRLLWQFEVSDLGPYRAIRWSRLKDLEMCEPRFGWTVEMQVKAIASGANIIEVPVDTGRREGRSKISGTLKGTVLAGIGIISTILKLRWRYQRQQRLLRY